MLADENIRVGRPKWEYGLAAPSSYSQNRNLHCAISRWPAFCRDVAANISAVQCFLLTAVRAGS